MHDSNGHVFNHLRIPYQSLAARSWGGSGVGVLFFLGRLSLLGLHHLRDPSHLRNLSQDFQIFRNFWFFRFSQTFSDFKPQNLQSPAFIIIILACLKFLIPLFSLKALEYFGCGW